MFNHTHPHTSFCMQSHLTLFFEWNRVPGFEAMLPAAGLALFKARVEIAHVFHLFWNDVAPHDLDIVSLTIRATSAFSAGLPSNVPPGAKSALRTFPTSTFLPSFCNCEMT